jgi:hypothetical protein
MTVEIKTWRAIFLKRLSTICLMLAMFFNPFGFDALFKMTMDLTGSYWITDVIFYCIAGLFFGLYFFFNKKSLK